jgi:hypothetical protein
MQAAATTAELKPRIPPPECSLATAARYAAVLGDVNKME